MVLRFGDVRWMEMDRFVHRSTDDGGLDNLLGGRTRTDRVVGSVHSLGDRTHLPECRRYLAYYAV
jgi:hypothetical protein